jgi:hypothetical protein
VLLRYKLLHVPVRDRRRRPILVDEEQVEVQGIIVDGMCGIVPPPEIGAKAFDVLLCACHSLPPMSWAAALHLLHGLVIVLPFGRFIELRIAQGHIQRGVAHEFFDHL